jgi:hypothetical protein
MPDGWDEWPQNRRTLWRREVQADRMERLELESDEARMSRGRWVAHLRSEAADLRRQLAGRGRHGLGRAKGRWTARSGSGNLGGS